MTKLQSSRRHFTDKHGKKNGVLVTNGRSGIALAFIREPSHRLMLRGALRPMARSRQYKGKHRGLVMTDVRISREGALAAHAALGEFLFGKTSS